MSSFTVIVPVTSRGWQRSFCIDELCWSTIVDHDAGVCVWSDVAGTTLLS